jgi:hypothetical protein
MEIKEAILAFSQSEKIKTGLIWASQLLELHRGLPDSERRGSERTIKAIVDMIANEIRLSSRVAANASWKGVERAVDQGMIMINSGVASESVAHLTLALSRVTGISHDSMSFLRERGML